VVAGAVAAVAEVTAVDVAATVGAAAGAEVMAVVVAGGEAAIVAEIVATAETAGKPARCKAPAICGLGSRFDTAQPLEGPLSSTPTTPKWRLCAKIR
jgi:hypothetical protein